MFPPLSFLCRSGVYLPNLPAPTRAVHCCTQHRSTSYKPRTNFTNPNPLSPDYRIFRRPYKAAYADYSWHTDLNEKLKELVGLLSLSHSHTHTHTGKDKLF